MPAAELVPAPREVEELAAAAELAGRELGWLVERVHEMHSGIAERAFGSIGAIAAPVRVAHDTAAAGAYDVIRAGSEAFGRAGAAALRRRGPRPGTRRLSEGTRGSIALGAVNGLIGDRLAEQGSPLATSLAIRRDGREVAVERAALTRAFPGAHPRIAVFVHGLGETEDGWLLGSATQGGQTYGSRLERELGFTPVHLRFNTGLRISQNGERLSELLERLVTQWPTGMERLALIGHSMGGLVIRSACHAALEGDPGRSSWTTRVHACVYLGSPHLGAPLAQGVDAAAWALRRLPETRAIASVLNRRSAGIRDLGFGCVTEAEWADGDPDALLENRRGDVPLLDSCRHHFVTATVTRDPDHPIGRALGDLLVRAGSGSGVSRDGRGVPFVPGDGRAVAGLTHFALLNHPEVYPHLREWLE